MKNVLVGSFFFLTACGYNNTSLPAKPSSPQQSSFIAQSYNRAENTDKEIEFLSEPTYIGINQQIFEPYCLSCHSSSGGNRAGINLESYENATLLAPRILEAIESGRMPLGAGLPDTSIEYFKKWIENGMPSGGVQYLK